MRTRRLGSFILLSQYMNKCKEMIISDKLTLKIKNNKIIEKYLFLFDILIQTYK